MSKVYYYITKGKLPDDLITNASREKFKKRWDDFEIDGEKLIYKPLNLEVVNENQREQKLRELYDDLK